MQDFRKLKVWEKAHVLTLDIYQVSKVFPREELYGLTSQMEEPLYPSQQILRKGLAEMEIQSLRDSCEWRQAQPVKWSMTSSWPTIWSC
jgi:hypothetical protein